MLDRAAIEAYCLTKNGVTKNYPFNEKTAVFKVTDKMFLLFDDTSDNVWFNVKCDPLYALELRSLYKSVTAGYHMSKKHWNSIHVDGELEDTQLQGFIDDSYNLVFSKLTKKIQNELQ